MVFKSIGDDEATILLAIMEMHNKSKPFHLDPTFSCGSFYKTGKVPVPELRYDINVADPRVAFADVRNLPLADRSVGSIIFDPPFMFNPHGTALQKNAAARRFSMFSTFADLQSVYTGALVEFSRILKPRGIVAFKCQDYTDSKTTMLHCLVFNWATDLGFYAKDIFIRYRNNGPAYNPNLTQRHARKFHSYWWVFQLGRAVTLEDRT